MKTDINFINLRFLNVYDIWRAVNNSIYYFTSNIVINSL